MTLRYLKRSIILLLCLAMDFPSAIAQDTFLKLPAFENVSGVSWCDSIYRFPVFEKGKIIYTSNFELDHILNLNYNIYFESMHYIAASGDTMSITNTREIKLVNVGDVTFFHDYKTGYYEVVLELPVSLAVKNTFDLEKIEFSNGARTTAGTGTDTRGLVLQYDRLYKLGQTFFFIDLNNTIHKATSNNILKLFSGHNDKIKEYLNKYRVNFQSKEDLIRLTTFCNQLNADLKKKQ